MDWAGEDAMLFVLSRRVDYKYSAVSTFMVGGGARRLGLTG